MNPIHGRKPQIRGRSQRRACLGYSCSWSTCWWSWFFSCFITLETSEETPPASLLSAPVSSALSCFGGFLVLPDPPSVSLFCLSIGAKEHLISKAAWIGAFVFQESALLPLHRGQMALLRWSRADIVEDFLLLRQMIEYRLFIDCTQIGTAKFLAITTAKKFVALGSKRGDTGSRRAMVDLMEMIDQLVK